MCPDMLAGPRGIDDLIPADIAHVLSVTRRSPVDTPVTGLPASSPTADPTVLPPILVAHRSPSGALRAKVFFQEAAALEYATRVARGGRQVALGRAVVDWQAIDAGAQ